ncbi:MAG: hypothetical protein RLY93_16245 [Sumerlaeia bacterium]
MSLPWKRKKDGNPRKKSEEDSETPGTSRELFREFDEAIDEQGGSSLVRELEEAFGEKKQFDTQEVIDELRRKVARKSPGYFDQSTVEWKPRPRDGEPANSPDEEDSNPRRPKTAADFLDDFASDDGAR